MSWTQSGEALLYNTATQFPRAEMPTARLPCVPTRGGGSARCRSRTSPSFAGSSSAGPQVCNRSNPATQEHTIKSGFSNRICKGPYFKKRAHYSANIKQLFSTIYWWHSLDCSGSAPKLLESVVGLLDSTKIPRIVNRTCYFILSGKLTKYFCSECLIF